MGQNDLINAAARRYAATKDPAARAEVAELAQRQLRQVAQAKCNTIPRSVEHGEMLSAANLGMLDALERYKPDMPCNFWTYAQHRIHGSIGDDLRAIDPNARIARNMAVARERFIDDYFKQHGYKPTDEQIEQHLCPSGHGLGSDTRCAVGTDRLPGPKDKSYGSFVTVDSNLPEIDDDDSWRYITKDMQRKQRLAFLLYYREGLTMKEAGQACGVSESMVSKWMTDLAEQFKSLDFAEAV